MLEYLLEVIFQINPIEKRNNLFKSNEEESTDFCEAYKSQILGENEVEEPTGGGTLTKVMVIIFLLIIITGISFYTYRNFIHQKNGNAMHLPPQSIQISDDDLVVTLDDEPKKEGIQKEVAIDDVAESVKIEIAKSELKEENKEQNNVKEEKPLAVPSASDEAEYLEELANLSKEIDKERN